MPTDVTEMARRGKEISENQRRKVPYWHPKEGPNQIRLVPPHGDRKTPMVEYGKVFNAGPNGKGIFTPRKQAGFNDCPYEAYINALTKCTDEASKKELDKLRMQNKVGFIIIDRADEAAGPQLWETTPHQLAAVCTLMSNPDWGAVDDENSGVDLIVNYTPKQKSNNGFADYNIQPMRNASPLSLDKAKFEDWLSKDWFKEFHVGEPSTVEWINAVLTGTEASLRRGGGSDEEESAGSNLGPGTLPAASGYPFPDSKEFYAFLDGQPKEVLARDIFVMVIGGQDPLVCPKDDTAAGWKQASALGFKVPVAPPPAPPAPPAPPVMQGPPPLPTNGAATPPWEMPNPAATGPPAAPKVSDDIRSQLMGAK